MLYRPPSYADTPSWHTTCCQPTDTTRAPGGLMLLTLGWMLLAASPPAPTLRDHDRYPPARVWAAGRVSVWTDRDDPYPRGEAADVFLRVDQPSYVAVFRVDTDGRIRVLFPREPGTDTYVREERDFEVSGVRDGRSFLVDDDPG